MESKITLELYRKDDKFYIHIGDEQGGSGIKVEGKSPEEVANNAASYIADYFK